MGGVGEEVGAGDGAGEHVDRSEADVEVEGPEGERGEGADGGYDCVEGARRGRLGGIVGFWIEGKNVLNGFGIHGEINGFALGLGLGEA